MHLHTYIIFPGTCEKAFKFYERVLGAKLVNMSTHAGTPAEKEVPKDWVHKIMHAQLELPHGTLMGSDRPPEDFKGHHGFSVSLSTDTPGEAEKLFKGLSEGGKVNMPLAETFWAQRFGTLTDAFGVSWMINCFKPLEK